MRRCIPLFPTLLLVLASGISRAEESSVVPVSIACPACGAWIIDQPMLASVEGAIDALALSAMVASGSQGSAESQGMGGGVAFAAFGVMALNRLWAVPVNAWLASKPRGEPEWTSRSRHRLEGGFELVQASDGNGWIGIRGGIGDFRLGVSMALAGMDGGGVEDFGDTTRQTNRSTSQFALQADWGWAAVPRLRLVPGLKLSMARSTESVFTTVPDASSPRGFRSWDRVSGSPRYAVAAVPEVSFEITQWKWLAVTGHLGVAAWSSGLPLGKAGTWDAGFGLSARVFPYGRPERN